MSEVNYTEDMVTEMQERYVANPTRDTVNELAEEFEKSTRSIIAKLSQLGIYQAPPRTTKSGEPIVRKSDLVEAIEEGTGLELPSLVKATKADLQRLSDFFGS